MTDLILIRTVEEALAEAARRSGAWLACRPGCTQCCLGAFPINELDARRLRRGMAELESRDAARAARIQQRARAALPQAEDEPCPALDPETGFCDLYQARPMICRTFGPAVRCGDAVGACELCYVGATEEEIAACAVEADPEGIEASLLEQLGTPAETTISKVLLGCDYARS